MREELSSSAVAALLLMRIIVKETSMFLSQHRSANAPIKEQAQAQPEQVSNRNS